MRKNIHYLAGILAFGVSGMASAERPDFEAAAAEIREARELRDVAYVSGGVGLDTRSQMLRIGNDYNLHLIFSSEPSGQYLAFVDVNIEDERGRQVLNTRSDGPWFFADLPPGTYRVTATTRPESYITRTVTVGAKPTEVHFTWG